MTGFLDSATIAIPCAKCGRKTEKRIGWIKSNREFTCNCGTSIALDSDDFKRKIKRLEQSTKGLFK